MSKVMYEKRDITVSSQGRNGNANTHGIYFFVSLRNDEHSRKYDLVPKIILEPITSKGVVQNCSIDIPLDSFWRMIEELEKEGLRP